MTLSPTEVRIIQTVRRLSAETPEWRLTLSQHQRTPANQLQFEETVFRKVTLAPDAFLAVE